MTEPLIDRDSLIDAIADAPIDTLLADAVLAYLRSVLTPEALAIRQRLDRESGLWVQTEGTDLHRRIFGEDCACDETFADGTTRHTCPPARGVVR